MRKIIFILLSCALSFSVYGATFEQLRSLPSGKAIPQGFILEGIVISDFHSPNMELNPSVSWDCVDVGLSFKTAYLESPDGKYGVKLLFENIYANRLERYSKVAVDLSGCILSATKDPRSYTVSAVSQQSVRVIAKNVEIPSKIKKISELNDDDIYTFVTIDNLEFVDKQGSFCNIFEMCSQQCFINRCDLVWGVADGWATLFEDAQGDPVYMQVNSMCNWRRNNMGVPQGIGTVSGIVVANHLPRYGGYIGRYSLRPVDGGDIDISSQEKSHFTSLVYWKLDRNYYSAIKTNEGVSKWRHHKGITNCHVLAESGIGELYSEADCDVFACEEFDTRQCTDGNGCASRPGAALAFKSLAMEWFNGKGIVAKVSTKGASGNTLILDFSIAAGDRTAETSIGIPDKWTVQYSIDGENFKNTGLNFGLTPLAFLPKMLGDKYVVPVGIEAMGFSQYSVKLPSSLLGKDNVFIRIAPISKKPKDVPDEQPVTIRIGKLELKTLK